MIQAVIFDLNGVLANVGDCRGQVWRQLAKEQGISLDEETSRRLAQMEDAAALALLLKKAERAYSPGEHIALLARKNDLYDELISTLGQDRVLPGAAETLAQVRACGLKTAAAVPDENAPVVLRRLKLDRLLDAAVLWPRNDEEPAQTLRQASARLGLSPTECLAVMNPSHEEAALRCGMRTVLVGAKEDERSAWIQASALSRLDIPALIDAGLV